ncbi:MULTISPECIES: bifunctional 4-hydroxy-2-oxoglutarate aldolase/2-dehydro-3-deoxy-phosphogluconate aldolase [Olivibacter]|jgi:2-dehydro-3-deoxyphosphogluconate aldolase/(4S)-4-hydroxy-2-oxoglutarate aldolase|uniref:Bifunctional 4-hydroxy-2-oxoglutarate aldolase/2-dehydro-3-deoxy-phosphogluconate aldolase n=1 Tax=Olivibacter oleidegradans TaxID=760123 RepID=A0ABV6HNF9_9SPHI|nr:MULTISPECIES: bifunctional 4-hydroxy-2-oxoglutarate aldolase/2-dehydro-3-deoxy-phosphogluconate aldolase [Olivibacter]QEL03166.1 bifunctional 4-hydroxy-2-oxoglutarate aldolase/2-dehydro-3-deoxy-phosphogluconate aldolase [Olivibacter sp. LS-1]
MSILQHIKENQLVAIVRGADPKDILSIAEALYEGGIRLLEITMNSTEPLAAIEQVSNKLGDKLIIGAGTVLDSTMAKDAIHAGAHFILSPILDKRVIETTKSLNRVSIPGAYTATEIYQAYQMGADIIKVFPATSPSYLKDIAGPLPYIPLLPTGGITIDNIANFKKAGAVGFGIGSALVDTKQQVTGQYLLNLTHTARKFVEAVNV